MRREDCQEVAASHSSGEAGERPFRTPWSEGDAALWTGSWNHAEDTVPHRRVTAKRPSRVRDSDIPQRDETDALMCTSGSVGAPGSNPWGDPAPLTVVGRGSLTPTLVRDRRSHGEGNGPFNPSSEEPDRCVTLRHRVHMGAYSKRKSLYILCGLCGFA